MLQVQEALTSARETAQSQLQAEEKKRPKEGKGGALKGGAADRIAALKRSVDKMHRCLDAMAEGHVPVSWTRCMQTLLSQPRWAHTQKIRCHAGTHELWCVLANYRQEHVSVCGFAITPHTLLPLVMLNMQACTGAEDVHQQHLHRRVCSQIQVSHLQICMLWFISEFHLSRRVHWRLL